MHPKAHPCDLHVLSMPPAFALSQDQTLRFVTATPKRSRHRTKAQFQPSQPIKAIPIPKPSTNSSKKQTVPRDNPPPRQPIQRYRQPTPQARPKPNRSTRETKPNNLGPIPQQPNQSRITTHHHKTYAAPKSTAPAHGHRDAANVSLP